MSALPEATQHGQDPNSGLSDPETVPHQPASGTLPSSLTSAHTCCHTSCDGDPRNHQEMSCWVQPGLTSTGQGRALSLACSAAGGSGEGAAGVDPRVSSSKGTGWGRGGLSRALWGLELGNPKEGSRGGAGETDALPGLSLPVKWVVQGPLPGAFGGAEA